MTRELDRLELLAAALAGRPLRLLIDSQATRPWTDGHAVHLVSGDGVELRRQVIGQAALIGVDSLSPSVLPRLVGRRRAAERYLHAQVPKARLSAVRLMPLLAAELGTDDLAWWWGELRPRAALARFRRENQNGGATAAESGPEREADSDETASAQNVIEELSGLLDRRPPRRRRWSAARDGRPASSWSRPAEPPGDLGPPVEAAISRYPEWDARSRRYRPAWCTVREEVPVEAAALESPARHDELRRRLAPLGLGWLARRHRGSGDEIDLDAAITASIDLAAGVEPSRLVHVERVRRQRALAVLLLLDVSGSAADPAPDGQRVHDHQRTAAAALADTLHSLGDRVSLYAFRSRGRSAVEMLRVKGFDDGFSERTIARLGAIEPEGNTRLGAAVRHAAAVISRHGGTERQLLIVLSDGFAHDHGYEGAYGRGDARRALLEARRNGIGCLCLTIGAPDSDADLRRVFGATAHARADLLDHVAPSIGHLVLHALGSAERARRTHRKELTRV